MRVFSKSAGKFIEAPNAVIPGGSDMSSGVGSGTIDPDMMRKLFGIAALKNPKQAAQLTSIFNLINPPETADTKNRRAALEPAKEFVSSVRQGGYADAGSVNADIVRLKRAIPFGLGKKLLNKKEQGVVDLDQKLSLLKQNVVRSLQGARMSDTDIQIAESYIPSSQDSPETINTQLTNLERFIDSLTKRGSVRGSHTDTERPPLSAFDE